MRPIIPLLLGAALAFAAPALAADIDTAKGQTVYVPVYSHMAFTSAGKVIGPAP